MNKNIIGFSLTEDVEKQVKPYDKSIKNRQKELEDSLNKLVTEFQQKEKVAVIIEYNVDNFTERPISTRLIIDLKQ